MCDFYPLYDAVIKTVTLAVGVFAAKVAYRQWRNDVKMKRTEQLAEMLDKTRNYSIAEVLSIIDWDSDYTDLMYNGNFHVSENVVKKHPNVNDSNIEQKIDQMLGLYSHICFLYKSGVLTEEDMQNFSYRIKRISGHQAIVNYLFNLYHFSIKQETEMSFIYLVDYCISTGPLENDFKSRDCDKYELYLNI